MLSALAGGRILGERHGQGPVRVVALHGWSRTHADFARVLDGFDGLAPDLPGFGATGAPPAPWGAADYAAAIAPVLEDVGAPVVVLGHSFGGRVALLLAATRPELVSALVLTGVPLQRPPGAALPRAPLSFRAARMLHRFGLISDGRMEQRRRRSGSPDYRNATGVMRDVLVRVIGETGDGTYMRALNGLDCPVELVWGALDKAAPLPVAEGAAASCARASLVVLPGVGHLTPIEAPDALRAAVVRHSG